MAKTKIKMMTCLGENTVPICTELAEALTAKLGIEFVFDPIAESTPAAGKLVRGEVQMGWFCGLLYVMLVDGEQADLDLLAAPIFSGFDESVYFSHLIVPADSSAQAFADLRGKSLAINEHTSWSGNHLLRSKLCEWGMATDYFSEILVSGGHSKSMQMVADGKADCATIDHGVFDFVLDNRPEIMEQIRVIGEVGPSPAPPFVMHGGVAASLQDGIREAMFELMKEDWFCEKVKPHRLKGLVPVQRQYYDSIKEGYQNSLALK